MSFLCYAYIPEYRALKGAELRFDPRWNIHFDQTRHTLFIRRQDVLPDGFWGPHIHSLTAIVGQNAAGKSSALHWIMQSIIEGYHHVDLETHKDILDGIIIYSDPNSNRMTVYHGGACAGITIDLEGVDSHNISQIDPSLHPGRPGKINTLLMRGHFYQYSETGYWDGELAGMKNISDAFLQIHDLLSHRGEDVNYLHHSFRDYLEAHVTENNLRIARLLARCEELNIKKYLWIPNYITVTPNISGRRTLESNTTLPTRKLPNRGEIPAHIKCTDPMQDTLACFLEESMLNHIVYHYDNEISNGILRFWKIWANSGVDENNILESFHTFTIDYLYHHQDESETIGNILGNIHLIADTIRKHCEFKEKPLNYRPRGLFFFQQKDVRTYLKFIESEIQPVYLATSRFFDISYSHDLSSVSQLSSGEMQLLNLFSRIYDAECVISSRPSNNPFYPLIVLDEAETAFHPEWQRQYVGMLTDFLNILAENGSIHNEGRQLAPENVRFQVIYTTHSPTSLSDVPKCCVNFMQRDPQTGRSVPSIEHDETFGANVFDLYRDSFFMHDGLVGSFATNKIKSLVKSIEGLESTENTTDTGHDPRRDNKVSDIRKHIALIGDSRIREYITRLLEEKIAPANREASLLREIERLRQENLELHNRLNIRDND